jgi:protease-4
MKDFLKFTLATVCGILVTAVLLFFMGMITLFGAVMTSDTETSVKKNSLMVLDLNGTLTERSDDNLQAILAGLSNSDNDTYALSDILSSIKKAKENEDIKGIYIKAHSLASSFASIEAIRDALADFKSSGKFIITYADTYTQGLYYVSSVADKVVLNPHGVVDWRGIASTPIFYKDLLDKIGVEMQVFKVGTYKSAVEPYIGMKMSDANREQMTVLLSSIWGQMLKDVSESRGIPADSLNAYADRVMTLAAAEDIVATGMVDTLMYQNDMRDYLKAQMGIDKDDKLHLLGLQDMINVKRDTPKDISGNIVAVYYAIGEIVDQSQSSLSSDEYIVGEKVIRDLRKLKEDKDVKAVVLRVNSPGGSAFASEQIWKAVSDLKTEKPVIVSMGDYAASGGYYISCVADSIVAEPTTLTGSIGIFGMFPNAKSLTEKIGIGIDVAKTNSYSDFGNLTRPMNESEKSMMQANIARGYDLFTTRCSDGRGMSKEDIEKIAEGRVWTGLMAKEIGLVDELGGLDRAIDIAAGKAGIAKYTIMEYPESASIFANIFDNSITTYVETRLLKSRLGSYYSDFNTLRNLDKQPKIQARIPFLINAN